VQWFDDDVVVHNLHGSGFFLIKKIRNEKNWRILIYFFIFFPQKNFRIAEPMVSDYLFIYLLNQN
jgi:hypothetical protein